MVPRLSMLCILALSIGLLGCPKKEPAEVKPAKAASPVTSSAKDKAATPSKGAEPAVVKPVAVKPAAVKPAARGLDAKGRLQPSAGDRCPVCAMRITKDKKLASAIELTDERTYYFCGTGCMIKSWRHPEVFLGVAPALRKRAVAPEYFAGEMVDALAARWVAGSDVVGPMGPALVPLKSDADVETFKRRHGGKVVFKIDELTDDKWKAITGKDATKGPAKR